MSRSTKLASKLNKLSHGTSRLIVRDSYRYAASTMIGFIVLATSLCLVNNTYATTSSITVTIDDNIVDLNVAPTTNGAFSKSSASKIGVATTNYTGYTLSISAQGEDNPTKLMNGDEGLTSIENTLTEDEFKALDATGYNNMWGYLPSKYNSASNTSFLPSPTADGDTLDITSTANTIVNEYEITLGARVDSTASLGSYGNVFLVEAVANAIPYTIIFDDNVVGSMPTDINDETTGATVTLPNNIPVRDGYTFLGWCSAAPTTTTANNTKTDTCPSPATTYPASGTITLDQTGGNNDYHLYAMWQELTMQTFTNKMCSTYATNQDYTLKDIRDGKTYTVRYINGNCWMTQNLAIEPGTHMTANDTNITSTQYNNTGYYSLPGEGYDLKINGVSGGNCYGKDGDQSSYGGSGWTSACSHLPDIIDTTNTRYTTIQLGAWYNYPAATAGSNTDPFGTSVTNYSLCPYGWKLPSRTQANSLAGYIFAINPLSQGWFDNSAFMTGLAAWWTSNLGGGGNNMTRRAIDFEYDGTSLSTYDGRRSLGLYIRCIHTS